MYIPTIVTIAASATMETLLSHAAEHGRSLPSSASFDSVMLPRQEAIAPSLSLPVETSVVLITSTTIVKPSTTSISREPPVPSSIVTTPSVVGTTTHQISTITTIHTVRDRTSEVTPSTTTTTTQNDLPARTIASTEIASTANPSESAHPTPTNAAHPSQKDGKHIGMIAGIAVGSIFGAILLVLFVYWIYACYRGVNVCNCFGGSGRKDDQERQSDTLPSSTVLYPMSGIGAAPRMNTAPRPLVLPHLVANDRAPRLKRKSVYPSLR
jgi:hypothetical protein